jgi:hypothetical protein
MGVVAPLGKHCVEMRFSPSSVRLGCCGSILGLGLLMTGLCCAAATGQMAGKPTRRFRAAQARRRGEFELPTTDAGALSAAPTYLDDNPFVRTPKL